VVVGVVKVISLVNPEGGPITSTGPDQRQFDERAVDRLRRPAVADADRVLPVDEEGHRRPTSVESRTNLLTVADAPGLGSRASPRACRTSSPWTHSSWRGTRCDRNAAIATELASFGSFFWERPEPNTLTLDASSGGTSNTVSPAGTSCWGQEVAEASGGLDRPLRVIELAHPIA
jgi:hypothetical protein